VGDICSRMKAYYEALRVGKSLNRDKNASNNRIENREGSRDKKTLKMLFNIISHYKLPRAEKNNAEKISIVDYKPCWEEFNRGSIARIGRSTIVISD